MSEYVRKYMRAAPTLTRISAQACPLNVSAMMRQAWIDSIDAAIKRQSTDQCDNAIRTYVH
jgi:hypothetical protein